MIEIKDEDLRAIMSLIVIGVLVYFPLFDPTKGQMSEEIRKNLYTILQTIGSSILITYFTARRIKPDNKPLGLHKNVIRLLLMIITISGLIVGGIMVNLGYTLDVVNWSFIISAIISIGIWLYPQSDND